MVSETYLTLKNIAVFLLNIRNIELKSLMN
jgi:hypothetical protein